MLRLYDCSKHYYENQLVIGKIDELNAHRNDFELIDKTTSIKAGNCYLSLVMLKQYKNKVISNSKIDRKTMKLVNNLSEFDVVGTVRVIKSVKEKEIKELKCKTGTCCPHFY